MWNFIFYRIEVRRLFFLHPTQNSTSTFGSEPKVRGGIMQNKAMWQLHKEGKIHSKRNWNRCNQQTVNVWLLRLLTSRRRRAYQMHCTFTGQTEETHEEIERRSIFFYSRRFSWNALIFAATTSDEIPNCFVHFVNHYILAHDF